jgi:hypothetical protein
VRYAVLPIRRIRQFAVAIALVLMIRYLASLFDAADQFRAGGPLLLSGLRVGEDFPDSTEDHPHQLDLLGSFFQAILTLHTVSAHRNRDVSGSLSCSKTSWRFLVILLRG